jgi:predicted nuclease of predicted toxin-antitoxin system
MRLLLDMNLSPDLRAPLIAAGHECVHWSSVGAVTAPDEELMAYAKQHSLVLLTHDLDFGAILAASKAAGPSVVQIRTDDVLAPAFMQTLVDALARFATELSAGAIVVVDLTRSKVRILPIVPP